MMAPLRNIQHSDFKGIIFRRTFPQLREILDRCFLIYKRIGGVYRSLEHRWYFPSGATITLSHMQGELDMYNHQGQEYQFIGFDEAGQFLPVQILYLYSRLRTTNPNIRKQFFMTSNPGGPAHTFLKDRYRINTIPSNTVIKDDRTQMTRVYIPAKLQDNPSLYINDPDYVNKLLMLPEVERARLMDGNWDIIEGSAFPELNLEVHGFEGELPAEWERYSSFDWGFSSPFAYIIYAVDDKGALWIDDIDYGINRESEWKREGLKLTDEDLAHRLLTFENSKRITPYPRLCDPSCWKRSRGTKEATPGPSVAEVLMREGFMIIPADNNRLMGRQELHRRLRVNPNTGLPALYIRKSLTDIWETLASLVNDDDGPNANPEDIQQGNNVLDDIYDSLRYGIMWRPMAYEPVGKNDAGTFQGERRRFIEAKKIARNSGISMRKAYEKVNRKRRF